MQPVSVSFKDENGRVIIPSNVERDIVLNFIGRALASPVTGLVVVIGSAWRDIRLVGENLMEEGRTEIYRRRRQEECKRMSIVYNLFGSEISSLANSNYPREVVEIYKSELIRKMSLELSKVSQKP